MKATAEQLITAGEFLAREAKRAESIVSTAAVLQEVGTLQARAEESERRIAAGTERLLKIDAEVKAAQDSIDAAHAKATEIIELANAQASNTAATAQELAEKIVTVAKQGAAKTHADISAQNAQLELAAKEAQRNAVQAVSESKIEVERLDALLRARGEELKELEDRLTKARAEAQKILRG